MVIEQYKKMLTLSTFITFQMAEFREADVNNDGRISFDEYQNMSPRDKENFQAFLESQNAWEAFNEARSVIYDRNLAESTQVRSTATAQEREHSDSIEGGADIFSGGLIRPGQSGRRVTALQEALSPWFKSHEVNGNYDEATRSAVAGLQNFYNENSGQSAIAVDGIFGNQGRQALRWMQETHGQTNQQDEPRSLRDLFRRNRDSGSEQSEIPSNLEYRGDFVWTGRVLSRGDRSRSDEIYNMQVALVKAGHGSVVGNPDGIWGGKTTRALRRVIDRSPHGSRELDGTFMNQVVFDTLFRAAEGRTPNRVTESSTNYSPRSRIAHNQEVASQREQLSEQLLSFPPADPRALQTYLQEKGFYTMAVDGAFGPGSISALQQYLTSTGDYTGPISGKIGPLTRAGIESYNSSLQEEIDGLEMYRNTSTSRSVDVRVSNRVEAITSELDRLIDVSILNSHLEGSSQWIGMVQSIAEMNMSGEFNINVWNEFISHIQNNPNFSNIKDQISSQSFLSRLSDRDKYMILTRIGENTMGGNEILRAIQSNNIEEIKRIDDARSSQMLGVLSERSGVSLSALANARQEFVAGISSYTRGNQFRGGEVFSTRMRSEVNGIVQPMFPHEVVQSNGQDYLQLGQKSDTLVNKMSQMYLESISDNIMRNYRIRISADELRQALLGSPTIITEGNATIDVSYHLGYFKSADCFNDAVGVIPQIAVTRITEDGRDGPGGPPDTEPGEPGDASTDPGEGGDDGGDGGDDDGNPGGF